MTGTSRLTICALLLVSYGGVQDVHATSEATATCATPPPGLSAWYTGDNDGADSAGGHHGALLSGTRIAPGQVGNGFHLDGGSSGIQVLNHPDVNFGTGRSFSIEGWVSVDASVANRKYLSLATKQDASGRGFTFFLSSTGEIGVQLANSSTDFDNHFSPAPTVRDGRFHHVAVTVDRAAGVSFYVDGVRTAAAPHPIMKTTDVTNSGNLYLGRHVRDSNCTLAGVLDEVSIYSRVLSPSEIARIHRAGVAGKCGMARPAAAGVVHTFLLTPDGTLWAAGRNNLGQLGDGTYTDRNRFVQVLTHVVSVVAKGEHTLALRGDGTLWATGYNDQGQLGDGANAPRNRFVEVLSGVASIVSGNYHSLAVKTDGTLWATGRNDNGQLGDGTNTDRNTFVRVLAGVASAAADDTHTLAVKTDGTLWATGSNAYGELGDGTNAQRNTFAQVLEGVVSAVAGTNFSQALRTDGTLWATGRNGYGQLGDDTGMSRNTFTQVLTSVASVVAGHYHTLAVRTDGTLWATGWNLHGQLGDGTRTIRYAFLQVLTGVTSVTAGGYHSLATTRDGALWATGDNHRGQLGDGTNTDRIRFASVAIP